MDKTTELVSSYASSLSYSDLTPEAVHHAKRAIIDTLGCAVGGFLGEPSKIARRQASLVSSKLPSRILGTSEHSSPDMAAFANTVMANYLNMDDLWYEGLDSHRYPSRGHPARVIPAILAVADPIGAGGRAVIAATVVAYDVVYRICDQVDMIALGWNQSLCTGLGSAAGLGNLMGLSQEQLANALSMTAINGLPLRQTRASEMPMWKCCDSADANRRIVNYIYLAQEGLTAPGEPFDGQWGLWRQSGAGNVELEPFGHNNQSFKITQINQKAFPCQGPGQIFVSLALELSDKVKIEEIEAINIETFRLAMFNVGGGPDKPEKLNPQTMEDANHSPQWQVAVALRDGAFTPASFTTERIRDPGLRPLIQKVKLIENPEFTRQFPQAWNTDMQVVTRSGEQHRASAAYPKGHRLNPLTDQELEAKFVRLAQEVLTLHQCSEALNLLWRLDELENVDAIFDVLQV